MWGALFASDATCKTRQTQQHWLACNVSYRNEHNSEAILKAAKQSYMPERGPAEAARPVR